MSSENEQELHARIEALETRYEAFCKDVYAQSRAIYGRCSNAKGIHAERRASEAAELAAILMTTVQVARQQGQMQQEQAGGYDLNALRVDVTSASNSETGFEREE